MLSAELAPHAEGVFDLNGGHEVRVQALDRCIGAQRPPPFGGTRALRRRSCDTAGEGAATRCSGHGIPAMPHRVSA